MIARNNSRHGQVGQLRSDLQAANAETGRVRGELAAANAEIERLKREHPAGPPTKV